MVNRLKKCALFYMFDAKDVHEDGITYFQCDKPECCGIRINPGPILTR